MANQLLARFSRGQRVVGYVLMVLLFLAWVGLIGWLFASMIDVAWPAWLWVGIIGLFVPFMLYPRFFLEDEATARWRRKLLAACVVLAVIAVAASTAFIVFLVVSD